MTPIQTWAQRWGVSLQAVNELLAVMGLYAPQEAGATEGLTSEAAVQQQARLIASKRGDRLWRNNVGACEDKTGRLIRYGLAHDSAGTNRVFKSSDLIGITRLVVTPQMVGHTVGLFTAKECKAPDWTYHGDRPCSCQPGKSLCKPCHERAQFAFLQMVNSMGGIGRFVNNPEDL